MLQADNQEAPEGVAHTSGPGRTRVEPILAGAPLTSPSQQQLTLSIIIKALNEERYIASAIESALGSVGEIDGEVILADGGSTDRTIEIARQYPIIIVQLNQTKDRSCGSGAQLGFQYSRGRYLLLMDGDMRLDPGFLPVAIEMLEQNPRLAGVGGKISEPVEVNEEYEQRHKRFNPDNHVGPVTRLDSSGLYRRAAIEFDRLFDRPQPPCFGGIRSRRPSPLRRLDADQNRSTDRPSRDSTEATSIVFCFAVS